MKKLYLLFAVFCLANNSFSQLTVTATAATPTICAGNSTTISASASPVGYKVSKILTNPQPLQGLNYLAQSGVDVYGLTAGNLDDGRWDGIALPFTFQFYGIDYNYLNISTNGWVGLGFTNSVTTGINTPLPNASAPNAVIHAVTSDLNFKPIPNLASNTNFSFIEYFESGSFPNRTFVVNYGDLHFFSGGNTANVQVILYETSNIIEIHTSDCNNTTLGKLQGLENSTGSVYSVVAGRNNTTNWAASLFDSSYQFTPDAVTFTWSPSTGLSSTTGATVTATPPTTQTYNVAATNLTNGATGNSNVTVTINAGSYALAATAGGAPVCQNISVSPGGTNYRDPGTCNLISYINPAGGSPVNNSINTCIKLDTGATKRGTSNLYGARKYDVEPLIAPTTSTANLTLYFLQSEFNNFNAKAADSGHKLLPTGPADASGISNLVIKQFHGTGTNPLNYTGGYFDFIAGTSGFSVTWNASRSWWEVIVPVNGFSGFYLTSKKSGFLPINLIYFKGVQVNKKNLLNWKVYCSSARANFELERSNDALHFATIASITADQLRCEQPFDFTDENPLPGSDYYRLKIVDINGKTDYSNIVLLSLKPQPFELMSLNPSVISKENALLKVNASDRNELILVVTDFSGRRINSQYVQMVPGTNQFTINTANLPTGAYQLTGYVIGQRPQSMRFIKH